jgi:hypothetical protein
LQPEGTLNLYQQDTLLRSINMEKVRELMKNPLYTAIAAGVVGLLLGWMFLGWVVWPVSYTDSDPSSLRQDFKEDYARMAVDSYTKNTDRLLAKTRFDNLGKNGSDVFEKIKTKGANPADVDRFIFAVKGLIQPPAGTTPVGTPVAGQVTGAKTGTPGAAGTTDGGSGATLLLVLCLVLLVIGAALAYLLVFRGRKIPSIGNPFKPSADQTKQVERPAVEQQGTETPIAQFMTSYKLGVDLYDDSFSIDSPTGEFLGECGVGISETIGVGDPKKVTAFEVWLFDKNDIQTVTKVMMSDHAFNDPAIFQKLSSKGEPLLIEPGKTILLETATLQLEARIVDMGYGSGALPANSYFDRITLELALWPKAK